MDEVAITRVTLDAGDPGPEELRREAFRLRYRVLAEGAGDHRYADPVAGIWCDAWDDRRHTLLLAERGGRLVGTARVYRRCDGEFFEDDVYAWRALAQRFGIDVPAAQRDTGLIDRFAVVPEHRDGAVMSALFATAEEHLTADGCSFIVGVIRSPAVRRRFQRFGLMPYR